MEKMMSYVFKHMHDIERDMGSMAKILYKQHGFNKIVAVFTVLTTMHICKLHSRIDDRNKNINDLSKEVEELKEMKGV